MKKLLIAILLLGISLASCEKDEPAVEMYNPLKNTSWSVPIGIPQFHGYRLYKFEDYTVLYDRNEFPYSRSICWGTYSIKHDTVCIFYTLYSDGKDTTTTRSYHEFKFRISNDSLYFNGTAFVGTRKY